MIKNALGSLAVERAELVRDVLYMEDAVSDTEIDADDIDFAATADDDDDDDIDDETLNDLLAAMPDTKDEELERIMKMDGNDSIDLDDALGLDDDDYEDDLDDDDLDNL